MNKGKQYSIRLTLVKTIVIVIGLMGTQVAFSQFSQGNVYLAGFGGRDVAEFDPNLNFIQSWTHPSFTNSQEGPAGMVFDQNGDLVVAGYSQFCVFSGPNQLIGCFPKVIPQRTENIIFDILGNLYTTTSTGGSNQVHKYNSNYSFQSTFSLPTGQLTGITCNPNGDLFIASQSCGCIYKLDGNSLQVLDIISGVGNNVEGIQYTSDGKILLARSFTSTGIIEIEPFGPSAIQTNSISNPNFNVLVPVTVDNSGNYYSADHNGANGNVPSDLFKFDSGGNIISSSINTSVEGPFGMVVSGTVLPCGAFNVIPTLSQWGIIILGLIILCYGAINIQSRRPFLRMRRLGRGLR